MLEKALTGLLEACPALPPVDVLGTVPEPPPSRPIPLRTVQERFLSRPEFLTGDPTNKAENEAAIDRALQMSQNRDVAEFRAMALPPSPKLKTWHQVLVREVECQVSAASQVPPSTASSYWVVPRRWLAGAYPGAAAPAAHRQKVSGLINAGVRVFINLMEQEETNHQGEAFAPYEDLVRELSPDATCVRFPIRDLSAPSLSAMPATLDAIDRFLDAGETVYVHCWGGVGRTGTAIACWLLRHQRATSENVFTTLAALRQQDQERGHRDSPESPSQWEFVKNWSKSAPPAG